jgi:hypothetical protein
MLGTTLVRADIVIMQSVDHVGYVTRQRSASQGWNDEIANQQVGLRYDRIDAVVRRAIEDIQLCRYQLMRE